MGHVGTNRCWTGMLPHNFFLLRNWTTLDLSENQMLSGLLRGFPKNSHLEVLRLSFTSITGSLSDSIGNLKYLRELRISGAEEKYVEGYWEDWRMLTGMIPSSIWNLTRLVLLDLSFNNLIGTIPTSIGNIPQLEYLDLSYNKLNGPIPDTLFSHPAIQTLHLGYNQLSNQLNDSLQISTSLAEILLGGNQLQGQIPRSIFKLPALETLDLRSNNFSGTVELGMFERLKNLTALDLSNNLLSVHDASDCYFHSFPKLYDLSLASCNLTKIPAFLKYQDSLQDLDLSNNRIHGDIPKWIWAMANSSLFTLNLSSNSFSSVQGLPGLTLGTIFQLDLHSNMLSGPIPLPISSFDFLDYSNNFFSSNIPSNISSYLKGGYIAFLSFANNSLTGEIPPSICKVLSGGVLDLSHNNLAGSIPPCLLEGGPYSLIGLNLRGNQLEGVIPQKITSYCSLELLNLHGNQLEGSLPRSLANCSRLIVLDVGNNNLMDSFPYWLGNVTALRVLILRGNGFYGYVEIPKSHDANYTFYSLQIFDLSSNHFKGNLPSECFNDMKVMMNSSQLDSSIVEFSYLFAGILYQSIISVTSKGEDITLEKLLTTYTYIDLSNNRFQGNIPDVIGNLQGLHVLNFSHNALTGQIPATIGNLSQLESLDLSENRLSGIIPHELDSLSFLEVFNVSNNNLVGRIPYGTQFSTFPNTSFEGNPGLCGKQLSKVCDNANPNRTVEMSQSRSDGSSSTYVIGMALSVGLGFGIGMAMVLVLQNIPLRFWKRHDNN